MPTPPGPPRELYPKQPYPQGLTDDEILVRKGVMEKLLQQVATVMDELARDDVEVDVHFHRMETTTLGDRYRRYTHTPEVEIKRLIREG